MLDFRIDTFLKVCEYMNFTYAARALNLTQPAVSQHIKYLEKKYDSTLFERDKKNLKLTSSGKVLLSALKTMKSDEIALKNKMEESLKNKKTLIFGVTMTIGEYIIAPIIADFIKDNPQVNFHIRYGNTQTLLKELQEGYINFAIVEGYFKSHDYNICILKLEEYIAVASKNHNFAKEIKSLNDLTSERLITREIGSGTREILTRSLALKNISILDFENIIEVENIHAIVDLLIYDCGISFLYKSAVEREIKEGTLVQIPLSDFMIRHDFTFLWNKDSIFSEDYYKIFTRFKNYLED